MSFHAAVSRAKQNRELILLASLLSESRDANRVYTATILLPQVEAIWVELNERLGERLLSELTTSQALERLIDIAIEGNEQNPLRRFSFLCLFDTINAHHLRKKEGCKDEFDYHTNSTLSKILNAHCHGLKSASTLYCSISALNIALHSTHTALSDHAILTKVMSAIPYWTRSVEEHDEEEPLDCIPQVGKRHAIILLTSFVAEYCKKFRANISDIPLGDLLHSPPFAYAIARCIDASHEKEYLQNLLHEMIVIYFESRKSSSLMEKETPSNYSVLSEIQHNDLRLHLSLPSAIYLIKCLENMNLSISEKNEVCNILTHAATNFDKIVLLKLIDYIKDFQITVNSSETSWNFRLCSDFCNLVFDKTKLVSYRVATIHSLLQSKQADIWHHGYSRLCETARLNSESLDNPFLIDCEQMYSYYFSASWATHEHIRGYKGSIRDVESARSLLLTAFSQLKYHKSTENNEILNSMAKLSASTELAPIYRYPQNIRLLIHGWINEQSIEKVALYIIMLVNSFFYTGGSVTELYTQLFPANKKIDVQRRLVIKFFAAICQKPSLFASLQQLPLFSHKIDKVGSDCLPLEAIYDLQVCWKRIDHFVQQYASDYFVFPTMRQDIKSHEDIRHIFRQLQIFSAEPRLANCMLTVDSRFATRILLVAPDSKEDLECQITALRLMAKMSKNKQYISDIILERLVTVLLGALEKIIEPSFQMQGVRLNQQKICMYRLAAVEFISSSCLPFHIRIAEGYLAKLSEEATPSAIYCGGLLECALKLRIRGPWVRRLCERVITHIPMAACPNDIVQTALELLSLQHADEFENVFLWLRSSVTRNPCAGWRAAAHALSCKRGYEQCVLNQDHDREFGTNFVAMALNCATEYASALAFAVHCMRWQDLDAASRMSVIAAAINHCLTPTLDNLVLGAETLVYIENTRGKRETNDSMESEAVLNLFVSLCQACEHDKNILLHESVVCAAYSICYFAQQSSVFEERRLRSCIKQLFAWIDIQTLFSLCILILRLDADYASKLIGLRADEWCEHVLLQIESEQRDVDNILLLLFYATLGHKSALTRVIWRRDRQGQFRLNRVLEMCYGPSTARDLGAHVVCGLLAALAPPSREHESAAERQPDAKLLQRIVEHWIHPNGNFDDSGARILAHIGHYVPHFQLYSVPRIQARMMTRTPEKLASNRGDDSPQIGCVFQKYLAHNLLGYIVNTDEIARGMIEIQLAPIVTNMIWSGSIVWAEALGHLARFKSVRAQIVRQRRVMDDLQRAVAAYVVVGSRSIGQQCRLPAALEAAARCTMTVLSSWTQHQELRKRLLLCPAFIELLIEQACELNNGKFTSISLRILRNVATAGDGRAWILRHLDTCIDTPARLGAVLAHCVSDTQDVREGAQSLLWTLVHGGRCSEHMRSAVARQMSMCRDTHVAGKILATLEARKAKASQ